MAFWYLNIALRYVKKKMTEPLQIQQQCSYNFWRKKNNPQVYYTFLPQQLACNQKKFKAFIGLMGCISSAVELMFLCGLIKRWGKQF